MNILSVSNFNVKPLFHGKDSQSMPVTAPRFGITMAKPLLNDTVSFKARTTQIAKAAQQTTKKAGSRSDAITLQLSRMIRKQMQEPHAKLKGSFEKLFEGQLNPDPHTAVEWANKNKTNKKYLFTMLDRIKSEDSIIQKTASRGWGNLGKKELLSNMTDVSGFCFILEDKKSLSEFVKKISQEVKSGRITIAEAEYHRLPTVYSSRALPQTFDSLDPNQLQKLKKTIIDTQNPSYQIWKDVDSMSGYSGLHLIIKNADGTMSEVQVMTRAMHNLKNVENLFYKIRNNKNVDPKYRYIEQFMAPLKIKNPDNMTESEKALQKAIRKYTQEAYEEMLVSPFDTSSKFLEVERALSLNKKEKELLKDYDFNKIGQLMKTCEKIA